MAGTIAGAAASARSRLRESLRDLSSRLAGENRAYRGLDGSVYTLYAIECFLRALASTERGRSFVLKGGNLFRVWDDMHSFRPTGDLDMQCTDAVRDFDDVADLRREVAGIVSTEEFRTATGLVFPLDGFQLEPIRKGFLIAYRLEGKVLLGEPHASGARPAEIPFCLEVTYGPAPPGAVEISKWESVMTRAEAFDLPTSRPEWMAAEKLHSVVTRGVANSRMKDFRDLAVLLRSPTFDDQLMHGCIRQVFEELGQSHLVPQAARNVSTLSSAFATSLHEDLWQRRRWHEWEGREWDAGRDPTLAESIAGIVCALERKGVLEETPASRAASALADLCRAADELAASGPLPLASARFATALKALAPEIAAADPDDADFLWQGTRRAAGNPGEGRLEAFCRAIAAASDLGMMPAIDRGWDRGRGGGLEAVSRLRQALSPRPPEPARAGTSPARQEAREEAREAQAAAPAPRAARKPRSVAQKGPDAVMEEGVLMLAQGRPGTHVWFGGLAKVISSAGASVPPLGDLALDMPADGRAPYIWIQVAKRQQVEPDLRRAVEMAREIMGMESPVPALRA